MKIYKETSLSEFDAWLGAVETKERIVNAGKESEFEAYIEEIYPDGLSETELNDILWFDDEEIYEMLDIEEDEEVD